MGMSRKESQYDKGEVNEMLLLVLCVIAALLLWVIPNQESSKREADGPVLPDSATADTQWRNHSKGYPPTQEQKRNFKTANYHNL